MPFEDGNDFGAKSSSGKKRKRRLAAELLGQSVEDAIAAINRMLESKDPIPAAKLVLEYCYGKPMQAVELSGPDGKDLPLQLVFPSYKPPDK